MKKLIPIILLLILASCADSVSPDPETPPPGGTLFGIWYDNTGRELSSSGLYDPNRDIHFRTDLRVNGDRVWFEALGSGYLCTFDGTMQGDAIKGIGHDHLWNDSEGISSRGEAREIIFRR
jgi:hypothetical protein